ncbi:AMP-binding protein [Aquabacterium sp.]|uniref:AMP-binding protein n=1 Tax=Aquabacterium sp. TaxID=1872578 RepID=UPI002B63A68F|nr:AMP-binding protein [Aquabacterium sp.]HSW06630.1 AMP-binding protein [Aquabacterium sp.]
MLPVVHQADQRLPLLAPRDLDQPLAWRQGQPISGHQFLADVQVFAERLPGEGAVVSLCTDRYAFSVAFAAALLRGRVSLLPPNARPDTLAQLRSEHPVLCAATDDPALQVDGMPSHCVALSPPAGMASGAAALPGIPADLPDVAMPCIPAGLRGACLLTSGSTGVPQPHAKTWGEMNLNVQGATQRLCEYLGRPTLAGLNLVATVPAQHSFGFESSVLLAMLGGAAIDAGRPFYPADIVQALQSLPRPRALITTPFHLKALLSAGLELPPTDLVLSATAPLSPQLARQAESAFGGPLVEIYGCTEAGQVATRRTASSEVWCTFGDLRITRQASGGGDDGRDECFFVQGSAVPAPTRLGDVLRLDDARRFRLFGRANDLIHVAGRRSSLGHLNYHLNSLDGVQDGAFWLPDEVPDGVVRPVAFVVAPGISAAAIIAGLRRRLEAVFVPRRVLHVDALPREATGKLTTQSLRAFALAQLDRQGH